MWRSTEIIAVESDTMPAELKHIRTSSLEVAYEESGGATGEPVFLMHGWPYDPRCYDDVIPLVAAGCRVIVPYLRGFGATRFLAADTPRSGQQAALGNDLRELMDALAIQRAFLAGYDWGGRAACIVAALWPERVRGLVTVNSYNIQDIPNAAKPVAPEQEYRLWYQWYFQTERGRAGIAANRRALTRLLWELWSPHWRFDDATFERSAASFDNPDFVAVTIQSYRHRYGHAPGDPALEPIEARLAAQPKIAVPTIALQGEADGVHPPEASAKHGVHFSGPFERRVLPRIGHNPPQEAPQAFADAVLDLIRATTIQSAAAR
jgi:pimeloyl-ACP methyl ester carboxylesterase